MKLAFVLFLAALLAPPVIAQTDKQQRADLIKELAAARQTIAEREAEIVELRIRLAIAEKAVVPGAENARQQAATAVEQAKKAVVAAADEAKSAVPSAAK